MCACTSTPAAIRPWKPTQKVLSRYQQTCAVRVGIGARLRVRARVRVLSRYQQTCGAVRVRVRVG